MLRIQTANEQMAGRVDDDPVNVAPGVCGLDRVQNAAVLLPSNRRRRISPRRRAGQLQRCTGDSFEERIGHRVRVGGGQERRTDIRRKYVLQI